MREEITPGTTLGELAIAWLRTLRSGGRLESTTINEYERVLRKFVLPELGTARIDELDKQRMGALLQALGLRSVNCQRKAKVVTGAMLEVAVECGALASNPVRGSISVSRPKTQARRLTTSDLETVRAAVQSWVNEKRPGPRATSDMADIIDLMLGTGARIGEILALRWQDIDLDAKRVQITATIKTETGMGTYRKPVANARTIQLPEFALTVLRRRHTGEAGDGHDAVFRTRNGTWHQVNNVERRWRQIRTDAGLTWVTPEAFRQGVVALEA